MCTAISGTISPFCAPTRDDHRRHQRRDDDVVRGGRQTHAEDQRSLPRRGSAAPSGCRPRSPRSPRPMIWCAPVSEMVPTMMPAAPVATADADHVARAGIMPCERNRESPRRIHRRGSAQSPRNMRLQRIVGQRDDDHRHRRPEGRERRRKPLEVMIAPIRFHDRHRRSAARMAPPRIAGVRAARRHWRSGSSISMSG